MSCTHLISRYFVRIYAYGAHACPFGLGESDPTRAEQLALCSLPAMRHPLTGKACDT